MEYFTACGYVLDYLVGVELEGGARQGEQGIGNGLLHMLEIVSGSVDSCKDAGFDVQCFLSLRIKDITVDLGLRVMLGKAML